MSNPPNPLAKYRSYSYHQFLVACKDTATAEKVGNNIELLKHPERSEDRYRVRDGVAVIVDGMSDAHLRITKASWTTHVVQNTKTANDAFSSLGITVNGIIDIYEPSGAIFLGIIGDISVQMGISHHTMSFALKTIFVGHTTDGGTEYISGVKPLLFTIQDISAIYDTTGAKYRLQINGQVGSNTKHNQQVLSGSSIHIKPNEKLKDALNGVARLANESVKNAILEYQANQTKNGKAVTPIVPPQYRIKLSTAAGKQWNENIIVGDNENIRIHHTVGDPIINLSQGDASTVQNAIEKVLISSSAVMQGQNVTVDSKLEDRYIFSITHVAEQANGGTIHNFVVGRKLIHTTPVGKNTTTVTGSLEYDYIFTGKNTDILNWDMKIKRGYYTIGTATTTNSLTTNTSDRAGTKSETVITSPGTQAHDGSSIVPVQFDSGSNFNAKHYSNVNYPVATANFYNALSKQASVESSSPAVLTITGNPMLLDEMTLTPSDVLSGNYGGTINDNWVDVPTTVKINVRFPTNPDDPHAGFRKFWYDGLYTILNVRHIFSSGKFIQELTIITLLGSHPGQSGGEVSGGTAAAANIAAGVTEPIDTIVTNSDFDIGNDDEPNILDNDDLDPDIRRLIELSDIREEFRHTHPGCDLGGTYECFPTQELQDEYIAIQSQSGKQNAIVRGDVPPYAGQGDETIISAEDAARIQSSSLRVDETTKTSIDSNADEASVTTIKARLKKGTQ